MKNITIIVLIFLALVLINLGIATATAFGVLVCAKAFVSQFTITFGRCLALGVILMLVVPNQIPRVNYWETK